LRFLAGAHDAEIKQPDDPTTAEVCAAAAALLTQPMDVVKTRMQAARGMAVGRMIQGGALCSLNYMIHGDRMGI